MEGTVKWFNNVKNFGFITPSDGSKDIFVHGTGLKEGESIAENDKVTFEVKQGDKGPQAINVKKLNSSA
ncbi:MAG: cold-shock protein [Candidatus Nanoarchaeia archaeon]|nr:cold-shock protein [Candidatus Nanoarchaeia archaeon]